MHCLLFSALLAAWGTAASANTESPSGVAVAKGVVQIGGASIPVFPGVAEVYPDAGRGIYFRIPAAGEPAEVVLGKIAKITRFYTGKIIGRTKINGFRLFEETGVLVWESDSAGPAVLRLWIDGRLEEDRPVPVDDPFEITVFVGGSQAASGRSPRTYPVQRGVLVLDKVPYPVFPGVKQAHTFASDEGWGYDTGILYDVKLADRSQAGAMRKVQEIASFYAAKKKLAATGLVGFDMGSISGWLRWDSRFQVSPRISIFLPGKLDENNQPVPEPDQESAIVVLGMVPAATR